jgi:hypothetical protein
LEAAAQALKTAYHNYTHVLGAVGKRDFSFLQHRAGRLLHSLGHFGPALHLLTENLMLRQRFFGAADMRTGVSAVLLAQVELDAERLADAMDHCRLGESILRPIAGSGNLQLARLAMMRGNILDQQRRGDPVLHFTRADQILRRACGDRPHPDRARLLQFQGEHLANQGCWDEALAHNQRAAAMYRRLYTHNRFATLAELHHNQGHYLFCRGDIRPAWKEFTASRRILYALNPDHPWLPIVHRYRARLLEASGHARPARRMLAASAEPAAGAAPIAASAKEPKHVKGLRILLLGTPDVQPHIEGIRLRLREWTAAARRRGLRAGYVYCRTLGAVSREAARAPTHHILVAGLMGRRTPATEPSRIALTRHAWVADYRHREDTDRLVLAALRFCDAVWLCCPKNAGESVAQRFRGDLNRFSPPPSFEVAAHTGTKPLEAVFLEGLHDQIAAWRNGCVHAADRR